MKTNKDYFKEYNQLKNKKSLTQKTELNNLAYRLYFEAIEQGRPIKEYDVQTAKFKTEINPTLYIIGKVNPADEVIYIISWNSYYKKNKCSDDIQSTFKMYNRKQIDYFEFNKIKECI